MRTNRTFLTLVSLAALLASLLSACGGANQAAFQFEKSKLTTGDLTSFVVANGVVRPARSTQVAWKISGQVGTLLVKLQDEVKAGQKLAEISGSSLPNSILSAQLDLVDAQKNLDTLLHSNTSVEQARLEVSQAKDALKTETQKLNAVNQRKRPIADYYIQSAQAELQMAETEVDKAQNNYDHTSEDSDYKPVSLKLLAAAKQNRDKALANLNYMLGTPSDTELESAEAATALAQAKLDDAQRKYDRIKDGLPAEDIAAAQTRIYIAQSTLEQAYVTAPFSGTVVNVFAQVGDVAQPGGTILQIEDQSHMYVNAQVSEVDVNRMQIGQDVEVTLDAVYGSTYHGKVVEIGLSGDSSQGVVNFPLRVELTDRDEKVKTGMTAVLRIQAETVTGALLVPNQAVRVKDGQRVVYVDKGLPIPQAVPITLGISSETMSQVLDGDVKAGDQIIMNPDMLDYQNQQGGMTVSQ